MWYRTAVAFVLLPWNFDSCSAISRHIYILYPSLSLCMPHPPLLYLFFSISFSVYLRIYINIYIYILYTHIYIYTSVYAYIKHTCFSYSHVVRGIRRTVRKKKENNNIGAEKRLYVVYASVLLRSGVSRYIAASFSYRFPRQWSVAWPIKRNSQH